MPGLYGKYTIGKSDGTPVDPNAKYIVLRYDAGSDDELARMALLRYSTLGGGAYGDDQFCRELWADVVAESQKYADRKYRGQKSLSQRPIGHKPTKFEYPKANI